MKEQQIFVGIDVSKASLDISVLNDKQARHYSIKNKSKEIRAFFTKIQKQNKSASFMVCMESTGYYNWPTYEALTDQSINLYVVNPLHLKRSIGLARGKNDVIDSGRIAQFIKLHHPTLKPTVIARKQIRQMQALLAHRNRLVETKTKIGVPVGELAFIADKQTLDYVKKSSMKLVQELEKQIKLVESQLLFIVQQDKELKEKYHCITSVQGVGKILALTTLIKTNEFKSINNPRKLACYAGVVPFEHQSGTSINKKPSVSVLADKTLKKLLHMAALRVIRLKGDLQEYYLRKVAQGKNKMLVINAIRNKIVARMCATVNNKRIYHVDLLLS